MSPRRMWERVARAWRDGVADRRGGVAMMFAMSMLPLTLFVGAAVDYGRALTAKTQIQAAADSTALMLARNASSLSAADLQTQANAYFAAQARVPGLQNLKLTASYTGGSTQSVTVNVSGAIPTTVTNVLGFSSLGISSASTVALSGGPRLRVALVLDNTGSMAQSGKMSALQTATTNLIAQLQAANANPGDVYASIIPFDVDVNVGASNYKASWIDWSDWDDANGTCSKKKGTSRQTCNGTWTPDNHNTWTGCVMDRGDSSAPNKANYDTNVSPPVAGNTATLYPAEPSNSCVQAVLPLGNDFSAMTRTVANMSPNGNTNQTIGLVHGWLSLVGGGPYATPPAMDPLYQYLQVIILVTDGLNTADRWYSSESTIDGREAMTCTNIKAAGIQIYTIQVNTGNDPTSTVLRNCATDSSKFYMLTSSGAIIDIFQQIGANLTQLHISK